MKNHNSHNSLCFSQKPYMVGIHSVADYSPFGVELDGRTESGARYRYSFQGQEKDDEVKGEGNSINYKFRVHDPRVGRFFSVDPLSTSYPMLTPYQFSSNIPIAMVELEGKEGVTVDIYEYEDEDGNVGTTSSTNYFCDGCRGKGDGGVLTTIHRLDGSVDSRMNHGVNVTGVSQKPIAKQTAKAAEPEKEKCYLCYGGDGPIVYFLDLFSEDAGEAFKSFDAKMNQAPFEAVGINAQSNLAIPGGFTLQQKGELLDTGSESLETRYEASLMWSATGGQTGVQAGFSFYWNNPKFDSHVQTVYSGGIKYKLLMVTAGNQSVDIQLGFYNKSAGKAFLEGYLGKEFKLGVLIDVGFEIDVTDYLQDGSIDSGEMKKLGGEITKGFQLLKEQLDAGGE